MAISATAEVCERVASAPSESSTIIPSVRYRGTRFTAHLPHPHRLAGALVFLPVSFLRFSSLRFSFLQVFFCPAFSLRPSSLPVSFRRLSFLLPPSFWPSRGDLSFPFQAPDARPGLCPGQNRRGRR